MSLFDIDSNVENEILTLKPWEIQVKTVERSIFSIMKYIESWRILIDPEFQRSYVWTDQQAINLIDSLYKRLPIPAIFLAQDEEWVNVVIDWQQRLISLCRFYFEDSKIREVFKDLDSSVSSLRVPGNIFWLAQETHYSDDTFADFRFKFDNLNLLFTQINIINVDRQRQDSIIRLIFSRLNTGWTNLTPQELREAKYWCKSMSLIQDLSRNPNWKNLFKFIAPPSKLTENFFRAFAYYYTVKNSIFSTMYNGSLKRFLNDFAEYMNQNDEIIHGEISNIIRLIDSNKEKFNSDLFIHSKWVKKFNAQYVDIFIAWLADSSGDIDNFITNFNHFKMTPMLLKLHIVDQRTTQKSKIEAKVNFGISLASQK